MYGQEYRYNYMYRPEDGYNNMYRREDGYNNMYRPEDGCYNIYRPEGRTDNETIKLILKMEIMMTIIEMLVSVIWFLEHPSAVTNTCHFIVWFESGLFLLFPILINT